MSPRHIDGTAIFTTDADRRDQAAVAAILAEAWSCEVRPFGELCPVDFWVTKYERFTAVAELKCRKHATTKFSTVFLSARKWIALLMFQFGLGVVPLFVVKFTDEIRWCRVTLEGMGAVSIDGTHNGVIGSAGIEPLIGVPVEQMKRVKTARPEPEPEPELGPDDDDDYLF